MYNIRNEPAQPIIRSIHDGSFEYDADAGFSKLEEAALHIHTAFLTNPSVQDPDSFLPHCATLAIKAANVFFDELEHK